MRTVSAPTYVAEIYLAGRKDEIEKVCAAFCFAAGLCVSVESVRFIYTGGIEDGAVVRLVNYPRFPSEPAELEATAQRLAKRLVESIYQLSALLITPTLTTWITLREEPQ